MTFEEEFESLKRKETIEEVSAYKIGSYLKERAERDPSVARIIAKENKSLKECYRYVKQEVGKIVKNEPIVMLSDEPVYSMAIHYYDEDDIKTKPSIKAVTKQKENQAPSVQTQQPKETVKTTRKKKSDPVEGQISLFEV